MKRKVLALFTSVVLLAFAFIPVAGSASGDGRFVPGVYFGTAMGTGGPMTVRVEVCEDEIRSIFIQEDNEIRHRRSVIEQILIPRILEHQTLNVDIVSAATMSSFALIGATADALSQAGAGPAVIFAPSNVEAAPLPADGEIFDVIVVGAGVAGMFTAMGLYRENADLDVLVLEKSEFVGGSMTVSGGGFLVLDDEHLRRQGLHRTPQDMADFFQAFSAHHVPGFEVNRDLIINTGYAVTDLWEILTSRGPGPFDYGRPQISQTIAGEAMPLYFPKSYMNEVRLTLHSGDEATRFIEPKFFPTADVRLNSNVTALIVEDGIVRGVEVTVPAGTYRVYADNVILATGGIAASESMMREFNPGYDGIVATSHSDSDGAGFELTRDLGLLHIGAGVTGAVGADNPAFFVKFPLGMLAGWGGFALVNLDGEVIMPFQNEILDSRERIAFTIHDVNNANFAALERIESVGLGHRAYTVEDLADAIAGRHDLDREAFIVTMNQVVEDNDMEAPFYAVRTAYNVVFSFASLAVNEYSQPLTEAGDTIPGLYAVGELIWANFFTGGYANSGSGLALSGASGIVAAQHIVANMN